MDRLLDACSEVTPGRPRPSRLAEVHPRLSTKQFVAVEPTLASIAPKRSDIGKPIPFNGASIDFWVAWRESAGQYLGVAEGDSGGPMFRDLNNGKVSVRGIINLGSHVVLCANLHTPIDNCYSMVLFTDINEIKIEWDRAYSILTG